MLEKCVRDQWRIDDLDWTAKPRAMRRDEETAIVQYFTDMAGIERLAAALFDEQRRRAQDPRLRKIFATFVADEERHAEVAERLAAFYDVHRYRRYEMNRHLARFRRHFLAAIRHVSAEIANVYITAGEILLDVALLRSLDDYVGDEMSHRAMALINRDESRHIAVDFHMVEHYCSEAHRREQAAEPRRSIAQHARRAFTFAMMMYSAGPFLRDVFFAPMELTDPTRRRMIEAFKRLQLLGRREDVQRRPFTRLLRSLQVTFNHPASGPVVGPAIARIVGVDPRVLVELYTEADERRVRQMTLQQLADEILSLKHTTA